MSHVRVGLLLFVAVTAMPSVTTAVDRVAIGAAIKGCCACAVCADGDRCLDGATLAACDEACAAASCQRVGFSTKGVCEDGCGARPNASAANGREEGAR